MDLDSLITLAIFLLFFVFPAMLKIRVRKKKDSRPSFLGKMGDQIQKFVQELEQQGQRTKQTESENVWDMFKAPSELPKEEPTVDELTVNPLPPPRHFPEKRLLRRTEKVSQPKKQGVPPTLTKKTTSFAKNMCIKAHPLQNAVVWSEILSSPLALKNK